MKGVKTEYTAALRRNVSVWKNRLPKSISEVLGKKFLLFQGAPDLIIKSKEEEGRVVSQAQHMKTRRRMTMTQQTVMSVEDFRWAIK